MNTKMTDMKKLMKTFLLLIVMMAFPAALLAQSSVSNIISFDLDEVNELYMPPHLSVEMDFVDDNGNGLLEALEGARLHLKITNDGGTADRVQVTIIPERNYKGVNVEKKEYITRVSKNSVQELVVPFSASLDVAEMDGVRYRINVHEPDGFDAKSVLQFSTQEYKKAKLHINGVDIVDAGRGARASGGNPDGKIQCDEIANINVRLQNIGLGAANNVRYEIITSDKNLILYTDSGKADGISGSLSDLRSAQTSEVRFRLGVNSNYVNKGKYLPLYMTVTEDKGFGNIVSEIIPIPFNASAAEPEVVVVNPDRERTIVGPTITPDAPVRSTIRDIGVAPIGQRIYQNAVAVVIGTEKYEDTAIPRAPYAKRDAEVMSEYFKNSLGVDNVILLTDEKVTGMELQKIFDPQRGRLSRLVQPGQTDVFVYYSGHGVPKVDGSDVQLIPYDVAKDWISDYGFSLNRMYDNLASLDAKSVTVILDACFSGGSRPSDLYKSESIANQKLVMPDLDSMEKPWLDNPDFRVFTSSKGNQTSLGYDQSMSGLFTYFLAIGLQSDADKNSDGKITMTELVEFVTANVEKESFGSQTPQFYGNGDFIILKQ